MKLTAFVALAVLSILKVSAIEWEPKEAIVYHCTSLPKDLDQYEHVDIWANHPNGADIAVKIQSAAHYYIAKLSQCSVWIQNVQDLVDLTEQQHSHIRSHRQHSFSTTGNSFWVSGEDSFFDSYHSFNEIISQLQGWFNQVPRYGQFIPSIGNSIEGRNLSVFILTDNQVTDPKYTFWINGGQHAREWVSPPVICYILYQLIQGIQQQDPWTLSVLQKIQVVALPVLNPDGYEYSRTINRLWRKNRRLNVPSNSYGVDLNRNWDDHWSLVGSSNIPMSDIYQGTAPASEPEVASVQSYILTLPRRVLGIDYHSYSQLVLRSYGWTEALAPYESVANGVSQVIVDAIYKATAGNRKGAVYQPMHAWELYKTSGSTDDWMTGKAGMLGFTIELRDTGKYGFVLPPSQILPTCIENWAGWKAAVQYLLDNESDWIDMLDQQK